MDELLKRLVQEFSGNPALSAKTMREMLEEDREGFGKAALALLRSVQDTPGYLYLLTLLAGNDLLLASLCDPGVFRREEAIAVARLAARLDAAVDVKLVALLAQRRPTGQKGAPDALRVLEVVAAVGDGMRVIPVLVQLLKTSDPRVRSKVALLLGRINRKLQSAGQHLAEQDARVKANSIESLWGLSSAEARSAFREATTNTDNRVAGNGAFGLYLCGDLEGVEHLLAMADHDSARFRATAAWAMAQTQDPRFLPRLGRLVSDPDPGVRKNAFRAVRRIKQHVLQIRNAGQIGVRIATVQVLQSDVRLRVRVAAAREGRLAGLRATQFVVWDGSNLIPRVEIHEHPDPYSLSVGLVLPRFSEALGEAWTETAAGCLAHKRRADGWAVLKYQRARDLIVTPGGTGGPEQEDERLVMLHLADPPALETGVDARRAPADTGPLRLSLDLGTVEKLIRTPGPRETAWAGLTAAARHMLGALASARGARHLILLDEAAIAGDIPPHDLLLLSEQASQTRSVLHVVCHGSRERFLAWEQVCVASGGSAFQAAETSQIAEALARIHGGMLGCYEISWPSIAWQDASRAAGVADSVRVQVYATNGYGEDAIDVTLPSAPRAEAPVVDVA